MATHDNAPPPDGWRPEPRSAPIFDLVTRIKRDLDVLPDTIVLGEN